MSEKGKNNKNNNNKKRRIGSDEYTLDLESRILKLESLEARFESFEAEIKKRDERIVELEAENERLKEKIGEGSTVKVGEVCTEDSPVAVEAEKPTCGLLIIGDSIVDSVDVNAVAPDGDVLIECMRGATPYDIVDRFIDLRNTMNFKRIIVHVGTNLIPIFSPEYVANKIIDCMLQIKELAPRSQVAYSCLLPKFNDDFLFDINAINFRIAHSGATGPMRRRWGYVDHIPNFFANIHGRVNPNLFKDDAIHLSKSGAFAFNKSLMRLTGV